MKVCNGAGCGSAWNCDKCIMADGCEKSVTCDLCGNDCGEEYWEIDGLDLCCDCAESDYKRSVDW